MTDVEKHEKQFRGVWMPPEVMRMVEEDEINCKEAILLMMIDSLTKQGKQDCFASNEYLGSRIKSKEWQVGNMIKHLKKVGVLKQTGFDGRKRYLATIWNISHGADSWKITRQCSEKSRGSVVKNHEAPLIEVVKDNLNYVPNSEKSISASKNPDADGVPNSKEKKGWKSHPRWMEYATLLKDAIGSVRKTNKTSDTWRWAEALSKLQSVDTYTPCRIRTVLKWYCRQVRKGDLIKDNSDFIPIAYSGLVFREKFPHIEGAMKRLSKGDAERGPRIQVIDMGAWEDRDEDETPEN